MENKAFKEIQAYFENSLPEIEMSAPPIGDMH
jgi:hypothetical protein